MQARLPGRDVLNGAGSPRPARVDLACNGPRLKGVGADAEVARVDMPAGTVAPPALVDTELTAAHEVRTLVLSRHPAIAIETTEEERADALLAEVARETDLAVFEWTVTHGLVRRPGSDAVYGTQDPSRMLASIQELSVEGLFVLKDFGSQLTAPAVSRDVPRTPEAVRRAAAALDNHHRRGLG